MASRIIGLLLGLLLTVAGYMIASPLAGMVPPPPPVALGEFEGLRSLIGWGALALGGLAILAKLLPSGRRTKATADRRPAIAPITFADAPAPLPAARAAEDTPLVFAFSPPAAAAAAAPLMAVPPIAAPEPVAVSAPAVAPAAVPAPVTAPLAMPALPQTSMPSVEPVAGPPGDETPQETFGLLRDRLRSAVQAESWAEAGRILSRLPHLALTHRDRMLAAQDLGDFTRSQGRSDDAADAYAEALAYARLMHDIEPGDPIAASDLAGALINVGDMASDEARLDAALGAYEEAVALRRRAVEINRSRRSDRRALTIALERLADAREDRGHRVRALDLYRESAEIISVLASEDPQRFGADLNGTRTRLSELEARLAI